MAFDLADVTFVNSMGRPMEPEYVNAYDVSSPQCPMA